MKQMLFAILSVALVLPSVASAGDWSHSVFGSVYTDFHSDEGFKWSDGSVVQGGFFTQHQSGIYAELWQSFGLNDNDLSNDGGDETDVTLGWNVSTESGLDIDLKMQYYALTPAGDSDGDVVVFAGAMGYPIEINEMHTITPGVSADYFRFIGNDAPDGWLIKPSLTHMITFGKVGFTHQVMVTHDTGVGGAESGEIGQYNAELTYQATDNFRVEGPAFKVTTPWSGADDRDTETSWRVIGFNYDF